MWHKIKELAKKHKDLGVFVLVLILLSIMCDFFGKLMFGYYA